MKIVYTKDLKRGGTYWLTEDYGEMVGTKVKYEKRLKAPYFSIGDVDVKSEMGWIFVVRKDSWLYGESPNEVKKTTLKVEV